MYSVGVIEVSFGISVVWLIILSFLILRQQGKLNKLFPKDEESDIRQKFKELIDEVDGFDKKEQAFIRHLADFKKESLNFVQKVALNRYNPYSDTGGDQSVSIAFLDGKLNGFLLTSLHSRSGTRVYTKNITKGKSDIELSREERQVLEEAINKN